MHNFDLTIQPTRLLMKWLQHARACNGSYDPSECGNGIPIEEIKAELSTREHVPNKKEARAIRQAKAKTGR